MSDRAWSVVFALAALFNLVAGLPALIAPEQAVALFGLTLQPTYLFVQLAGSLIVAFAFAYALVALDLSRIAIVWVGIFGKAMAVALALLYRFTGTIADTPFALAMGDLLFVMLFTWFALTRAPNRPVIPAEAKRRAGTQ